MPMQMTASHDSSNDHLELHYDAEAQAFFVTAWPVTKFICRDQSVRQLFAEQGDDTCSRMAQGHNLLLQLAKNTARHAKVSRLDLQAAIELEMFAVRFRYEKGKSMSSLPDVIILLAAVTPYLVPIVCLPPATEVFDRKEVEPAVWESFERLRRWNSSGSPELFLLQLYHLWFALNRLNPTNDKLRSLLDLLGVLTGMFRSTMQTMAIADLSIDGPKPKRKRNDS